MVPESVEFYGKGGRVMMGLIFTRIYQKILAVGHRWTYQATPSAKNVVVLGGSYAGIHLAQRLTETLPTGYRAVLVERNSHFNHLFMFPRFGIVPGKEHMAFIPYDGIGRDAPPGIFQCIQDSATRIDQKQIQLASGKSLDYEYIAVATGSWQPPPAKLISTEKLDACAEMRASQERIRAARNIAVVGGGPVGIQVATDIKSFFPSKIVSLIHSRKQLLPNFGPRLHQYAFNALQQLKVNTILEERPVRAQEQDGSRRESNSDRTSQETLRFKSGREEMYDLVLWCTGQRPNSSILAKFLPSSICKSTGQILVRPNLQIDDGSGNGMPNMFALGDVAKTHGPRMERAARAQAEVVTLNILALINKQAPLETYRPVDVDGVIKLTLGKSNWAMYFQEDEGRELMVNGTSSNEDMEIALAWKNLGARLDKNSEKQ